jgi:hypothetical protein
LISQVTRRGLIELCTIGCIVCPKRFTATLNECACARPSTQAYPPTRCPHHTDAFHYVIYATIFFGEAPSLISAGPAAVYVPHVALTLCLWPVVGSAVFLVLSYVRPHATQPSACGLSSAVQCFWCCTSRHHLPDALKSSTRFHDFFGTQISLHMLGSYVWKEIVKTIFDSIQPSSSLSLS